MLQRGQWQFLLPALVVGANLAHAILPGPRWSQGCASVNRVLYCYGGSAGSYSDGTPHIYNDMYKLDFMTNLDVSDLSVSWDSVNLSSQPNPGYNWEMAIAASQELGILVMDGGSGKQDGVPLTYQTMIYHVSNGTWEAISNDVSPLQMHQEPMVTVNDTKMYRWSGFAKMQLGVPQPNNGTIWADNRMFVLDLLTKSWSAISPQNVGNIPIRTGHSATLSPDGNSIYYFGGLDMVPVTDAAGKTTYQTPVADMLNVLVYNTITTQFQTVRGTGDKPTNRTLATTTLMPNNRILLFGGALNTTLQPVDDPVYVITVDTSDDTPAFSFKEQQLPKDGAVDVTTRWGHSSVRVNSMSGSSYVVILMGKGPAVYNDFHILNTENLSWEGRYFTLASPIITTSTDSAGLSGGAIAGIVVGVVGGVAIIAGLLAFCCIRRKRHKHYSAADQKHPDELDAEPIQVPHPPPSYPGSPPTTPGRVTMTPVVKPDAVQ